MTRLTTSLLAGLVSGIVGGFLFVLSYAVVISLGLLVLHLTGLATITAGIVFLALGIPFAVGLILFGTVGAVAGALAD